MDWIILAAFLVAGTLVLALSISLARDADRELAIHRACPTCGNRPGTSNRRWRGPFRRLS